MNVTEYIASGILESYVMGAVSDQERREVECLSSIYPEIRQELDQLSIALENYALLYSVEPPASVKDNLLKQIDFTNPVEPAEKVETVQPVASTEPEAIVRPMPVDRSSPTFRVTWVVAASMGLLLLLFSFFLLSELRTNQKTLAQSRSGYETLQSDLRQTREQRARDQERLAVLQKAGMRVIELRGNKNAPNGDLLVYWNTQTRQVNVDVKSLPALPADKQYQLWSMVNGKPVDAGVFDSKSLLQVTNRAIGRADAFAVTIEKRGGSPTPTLSTLLALTPVNA